VSDQQYRFLNNVPALDCGRNTKGNSLIIGYENPAIRQMTENARNGDLQTIRLQLYNISGD